MLANTYALLFSLTHWTHNQHRTGSILEKCYETYLMSSDHVSRSRQMSKRDGTNSIRLLVNVTCSFIPFEYKETNAYKDQKQPNNKMKSQFPANKKVSSEFVVSWLGDKLPLTNEWKETIILTIKVTLTKVDLSVRGHSCFEPNAKLSRAKYE